jgi:addiction module RelE/StbE family toxin
MKLIYTQEAIADLSRLRKFIARQNPGAAARLANQLVQGITKLCDFPFLGYVVKQVLSSEHVREIVLGKYVVRYLVLEKSIHVLRIWHHRENRSE